MGIKIKDYAKNATQLAKNAQDNSVINVQNAMMEDF